MLCCLDAKEVNQSAAALKQLNSILRGVNTEVVGGLALQFCHLGDDCTFLIHGPPPCSPHNPFIFHIFRVAYAATQGGPTGSRPYLKKIFFLPTAKVNNFLEKLIKSCLKLLKFV